MMLPLRTSRAIPSLLLFVLLNVCCYQQSHGFTTPPTSPAATNNNAGAARRESVVVLRPPSPDIKSSVTSDHHHQVPIVPPLAEVVPRSTRSLNNFLRNRRRWSRKQQDQEENARSTSSASAVVDDDSTSTATIVPSMQKLLIFCAGTVAVWLSEPMLSIVDTTMVGLSGTTQSLAAMGPAVTLMDSVIYMFYFLALSITNLLGQSLSTRDYRQCQKSTSQTATVALVTGLVISTLLFTTGPSILNFMTHSNTDLTALAVRYCYVRGAVAPLTMLAMVAQAVCLATKDVATPIKAVLAASILNVIGDVVLVKQFGLVGVATATALSSVAACAILVHSVVKKMNHWRHLEQHQKEEEYIAQQLVTSDPDERRNNSSFLSSSSDTTDINHINGDSTTATTVLERAPPTTKTEETTTEETITPPMSPIQVEKPIPYLSLPDRQSLSKLVGLSFPLAFNQWVKMFAYFALTVKTADFGNVALASHNIMMRVFFFFGCFADALGAAAQTFLPAALYPKLRKPELRAILKRLSVLALLASVFTYTSSQWILKHGARFFTKDVSVLACLSDTSIWPSLSLLLHPGILALSGTVIATRNFSNLIKVYAISAVAHFSFIKSATSFAGVWQALVVFQLVRLFNYIFWSKLTPRRQSFQEEAAP